MSQPVPVSESRQSIELCPFDANVAEPTLESAIW